METTPNRLFYKVYIRGTTETSYFIISHHPQKVTKAKPELKSISHDHSNVTRHPLVRFVYYIINNTQIIPISGP